jgi:hypothetical protein
MEDERWKIEDRRWFPRDLEGVKKSGELVEREYPRSFRIAVFDRQR